MAHRRGPGAGNARPARGSRRPLRRARASGRRRVARRGDPGRAVPAERAKPREGGEREGPRRGLERRHPDRPRIGRRPPRGAVLRGARPVPLGGGAGPAGARATAVRPRDAAPLRPRDADRQGRVAARHVRRRRAAGRPRSDVHARRHSPVGGSRADPAARDLGRGRCGHPGAFRRRGHAHAARRPRRARRLAGKAPRSRLRRPRRRRVDGARRPPFLPDAARAPAAPPLLRNGAARCAARPAGLRPAGALRLEPDRALLLRSRERPLRRAVHGSGDRRRPGARRPSPRRGPAAASRSFCAVSRPSARMGSSFRCPTRSAARRS